MTCNKLLDILQNQFGHAHYKDAYQEKAVELINKGRNDVCIYMPSGYGKSLCYQLPILAKDNCFIIVISPSLAHAKSQIDYLKSIKVTAYTWNGYSSKIWIQNNIISTIDSSNPKMKILYTTPDVFITSHFQFFLENLNPDLISYFVVDEAHCVSSHSHDYKKSYEKLKIIKEKYPWKPIVAVTATANDTVKSDITKVLRLNSKIIISKPVIRSNLYYDVFCIDNIKNPVDHLKKFIEKSIGPQDDSIPKNSGNCGVIFCQNHNEVEDLSNKLSSLGVSVLIYSKKFKLKKRNEIQNLWTSGEIKVVITTSCFGRGISKQSVRFVVHWGTPLSYGHYYQETGRAGHDGSKSFCRIYYSKNEINSTYNSIQKEPDLNCFNKKTYKQTIQKSFFDIKESFKTLECRHVVICKYFDEDISACKYHCDNCKNKFVIDSIISSNKCGKKLNDERKCINSATKVKDHECIILSDNENDNSILPECQIVEVNSYRPMIINKKKKKHENLQHKRKNKTLLKGNSKCASSESYHYERKVARKTIDLDCDMNVPSKYEALSAEAQLELLKQKLYCVKTSSETNRKSEDCIVLSDSESDCIIILE